MKNRPLHENLDTSFVNLSALVRHLRRQQFAGNIRVELSGYEADIALTAAGEMRVREYDRIAGRISEGDEAMQRLLIRAREPGGIINVYQETEEHAEPPLEELIEIIEKLPIAVAEKQTVVSVAAQMPHQNGNSKPASAEPKPIENGSGQLPKLPFELSNKYEAKAKQQNLSAEDWQMLLNLTAELLNTIDCSLAGANLEFGAAFEKARLEIAHDYPFLNPSSNVFDYKNGKIIVRRQINAKLFAASINEALRRILDKLGRNPKFLNIYFITTQKIVELIEKRKSLYDKFFITPQLEKTVGA
jgi:hypothetical protein